MKKEQQEMQTNNNRKSETKEKDKPVSERWFQNKRASIDITALKQRSNRINKCKLVSKVLMLFSETFAIGTFAVDNKEEVVGKEDPPNGVVVARGKRGETAMLKEGEGEGDKDDDEKDVVVVVAKGWEEDELALDVDVDE